MLSRRLTPRVPLDDRWSLRRARFEGNSFATPRELDHEGRSERRWRRRESNPRKVPPGSHLRPRAAAATADRPSQNRTEGTPARRASVYRVVARVRVASWSRRRRLCLATALGVAVTAAVGAPLVSSATSPSLTVADQPRRQVVTALLRLTPTHSSASVSRRFLYADVGIESLRLTLSRSLHAELLILNPVESATGQGPSKMLCLPFRLCHDPGQTALRFCRDSGQHTICAYRTDAGAVFQAGRFVVTVRELDSRSARVNLRVVFVRGPGG